MSRGIRTSGRRPISWLGTLLAVPLVALAGGLAWFIAGLNAVSPDPDTPVDAIVVLTGGSLRLEYGLQLLAAGKGRKLFISGVHQGVGRQDMERIGRLDPRWMRCCVVLGHQADNTVGNAVETERWLQAENFHSIRLVTANYHMWRSLLEFRRALPADIRIIPDPVFPEAGRLESRAGLRIVLVEYLKYLGALARACVQPWMAPALPDRAAVPAAVPAQQPR